MSAFFRYMFVRFTHIIGIIVVSSFFLLYSSPLCQYITLLLRSLGIVFTLLQAIMNSAAVDILVCVWWAKVFFLLGIAIGSDLLGYKVFEYLVLVQTARQFSKAIASIYILTSSVSEFLLLYPLTKGWCFPSFLFWPLWWVEASKHF